MPIFSNVDEVFGWINGVVATASNFTMPGVTSSLGHDAAVGVAEEGIGSNSSRSEKAARAPDEVWRENSTKPSYYYPEGYKAWKQEHSNT